MLRRFKHQFEYLGTQFLGLLARIGPLQAARRFGRLLGRFTYAVLRIRRRQTLENLACALPELPASDRRRIARATYEQLGMMLVEYLRMPSLQPQDILQLVQAHDPSLFEEALQLHRGAILLTGHFGNWEYLGAWLAAKGYPVTYMVQNQANPHVSRLIQRYRERMGMQTVPRGMALRAYVRALRQGRFVAALADQDARQHGIFVDFFGRPASTPTGPARFALKMRAPIIFGVTVRDARGDLRAYFEKIPIDYDEPDVEKAIRSVVAAYTRALEKWIRRHPDHWFWMHRRWKTKPAANGSALPPGERQPSG